jgi:hypothetical protein
LSKAYTKLRYPSPSKIGTCCQNNFKVRMSLMVTLSMGHSVAPNGYIMSYRDAASRGLVYNERKRSICFSREHLRKQGETDSSLYRRKANPSRPKVQVQRIDMRIGSRPPSTLPLMCRLCPTFELVVSAALVRGGQIVFQIFIT